MTKIEVTDGALDLAAFKLGVSITSLRAALNLPPPTPAVPREVTQKGLDVWYKTDGEKFHGLHDVMAASYLAMKAMEKPERAAPYSFGMEEKRGRFTTRRIGLVCEGDPWEHRKDMGRSNGGRRRSDPR